MNEKIKKWFKPVIISLIVFGIVAVLLHMQVLRYAELRTYDLRISLRNRPEFSGIQAPTHFADEDVVIIPIDDKTLESIDTPFLFWTEYFANIFEELIENEVSVIAVDFQFQISSDEYMKGQVSEIAEKAVGERSGELIDALSPHLPQSDVRMARSLLRDKIILMVFMTPGGMVKMPYYKYMYAARPHNLALVNNQPDIDGVVRRQFILKREKLPFNYKSNPGRLLGGPTAIILAQGRTYRSLSVAAAIKSVTPEDGGEVLSYDENRSRFDFRGKVLPLDEDNNLLINYAGPPGTFMGKHSFIEVLNHAREGDDEFFRKNYKDKIVLIGPAYTGSTDIALTPYNNFREFEMYGVEVHANIINTLLNEDFVKNTPMWVNYLVIFIFALASCLVYYYSRPFISILTAIFLTAAYMALCFWAFYRYNLWMPMASPIAVLPLAYALVYAYRYISEDREKRFIRKVLGRYISESVAEEILKNPESLKLGGKRADVSILFCDINDFTTLSEKTSPEEVIAILNDYFTRMERVIFKNRATLKQFVGDEIMVICGAPQPDPEHARRICETALEMVEELKKWRQERESKGLPSFDVKFGLHSGSVVAGNVGSPNRTEYTTVGDVVNTASRIMGLTKKVNANILVSEETYTQVREFYTAEDKGEFPVKGKEQTVRVYHLTGRKNKEEGDFPENYEQDSKRKVF